MLSFVIFLIHSSILAILISSTQQRRRKPIQLLACVCLGHAFGGLATFATHFSEKFNAIAVAGMIQGGMALLCYSIDRCLRIRWPFLYDNLPKRFHITAIMVSPLFGAALTMRAALTWTQDALPSFSARIFITCFVFGASILLFVSNILVYVTLVRQQREIRRIGVVRKRLQPQQQQPQQPQQQQQPQQPQQQEAQQPPQQQEAQQQPQQQQQQQQQPPQQQEAQQQQQHPQPQHIHQQGQQQTRQPQRRRKSEFESFYLCIGCTLTSIVLLLPTTVYSINRINLYIHHKIPIPRTPPALKFLQTLNMLTDGLLVLFINRRVRKKFKLFFKF